MKVHADRFLVKPGSKVRLRRFDPADTRPFDAKDQVDGRLCAGYRPPVRPSGTPLRRAALVAPARCSPGHGCRRQGELTSTYERPQPAGCQSTASRPRPSGAGPRLPLAHPQSTAEGDDSASSTARTTRKCLIVRVHPEILGGGEAARGSAGNADIWARPFRGDQLLRAPSHAGERHSEWSSCSCTFRRRSRRSRFIERIERPEKNWKFSPSDVEGAGSVGGVHGGGPRGDAGGDQHRQHAPWYVIPADHKWFTHLTVAGVVIEALEGLGGLAFPEPDAAQAREPAAARGGVSRVPRRPGRPRPESVRSPTRRPRG